MKTFVQPGLSVPLPVPYTVTAEVVVNGVFDITEEPATPSVLGTTEYASGDEAACRTMWPTRR